MGYTLAQKIIKEHLLSGEMIRGSEIGLRIDISYPGCYRNHGISGIRDHGSGQGQD